MKAIPTLYRGIQMRSRLEAKWASVFDQLGWKWEYEPIDLDGWIPDFMIRTQAPNKPLLVEVKPVLERPVELCEKLYNLAIPDGYQLLIVGTTPTDEEGEHRFGWIAASWKNGCGKIYCDDCICVPGGWNEARDNWSDASIMDAGSVFGLNEGMAGDWDDRIGIEDIDRKCSAPTAEEFAPIWARACNSSQWKAPR